MTKLTFSVLFLLVFLGAGCGFTTTVQEPQTSPSTLFVTQPEDTIHDPALADWRMYRNDIWGYQFKFPEDWFFIEQDVSQTSSISGLVHSLLIGIKRQSSDREYFEPHLRQSIFATPDREAVMRDILAEFPPDKETVSEVIGKQEPLVIGGFDGVQLRYRSIGEMGSQSINDELRLIFVVRNNQTYVLGTYPGSEIHTQASTPQLSWDGFERLISSITFLHSQDFGDQLPSSYYAFQSTPLDLDGDAIDEFVLDYSTDKKDNGYTRTLRVVKQVGNHWTSIKNDSITKTYNEVGRIQTGSHYQFMKVVSLPKSDKDVLFVMKQFVDSQSLHRYVRLKYYVFGQQEDGTYDDFAIVKGYLHPEEYITETEVYSGCEMYLDDTTDLDAKSGRLIEMYAIECGGFEPLRTFTLLQMFRGGKFERGEWTVESQQYGFFIHDGFLWLDGMKLQTSSLFELLAPKEPMSIFDKITHEGKTYLYLISGVGCEGCSGLDTHYFVFNPLDSSIEMREFSNPELDLFGRGVDVEISEDQTKWLYTHITEDGLEKQWKFDPITEKNEEI